MIDMTGTEKQVTWAEDIKATVNAAIVSMISEVKSDSRYEANKAQIDKSIDMWTYRLAKLNACNSASYIIDFFGYIDTKEDSKQIISSIMAKYKVSINNGYTFK